MSHSGVTVREKYTSVRGMSQKKNGHESSIQECEKE